MTEAIIVVYGKPGCGKCEAAKDKLKRMGLAYEFRGLRERITPLAGIDQSATAPLPGAPRAHWRDDDTTDLAAAYCLYDGDMPLICVDGIIFNYAGAMKAIKKRSKP